MTVQSMPGYFFSPQHIVLVGASERAHSLGERILTALLGSAFEGRITPVNLRHKTVAGLTAYPTLAKISEPVDLVIAVTLPETYDALFKACRKQQFHHVIAVQDWETLGEEARQTAAEAVKKHHGAELSISVCNAAGIQLPAQALNAGTLPDFPAGYAALLTGHTAVSREIGIMLRKMQQGVSRHISLNYPLSPTSAADWLNRFGHNRHTRVAVIQHNPLENQRKLFSAIRQFARHTPVILYCPHNADDTERAVLESLSRHCNFLPAFDSQTLEAALHARLADINPVNKLTVLSDSPTGWLQNEAANYGIALAMPSEKPLPEQGFLGSSPTPALFRSQAAHYLQQPDTQALLAVVAPDSPHHETELTNMLAVYAKQSDKLLLISSRVSDGLLQFDCPEAALRTLHMRNQAAALQEIQLQTAAPKSGRLKNIKPKAIEKALAEQDLDALAKALNLPPQQDDGRFHSELAFFKHPRYGDIVTARHQGRTTAVLPPFTTLDAAHLDNFFNLPEHRAATAQFLHTLNALSAAQTDCGEIRLRFYGSSTFSSLKPSEKPAAAPEKNSEKPNAKPAAKSAQPLKQAAAEILRSRKAAAAEFIRTTGEAAAEFLGKAEPAQQPPENVLAPYPDGFPQTCRLKNGESAGIRPFEPEDAEAKQQFVRNLSPEARYTRFMAQTNELPPATLARFSNLDWFSEGAFVTENSDGLIIGVSRIARLSRDECEFGITLAESARGSGLAPILMQHIIALATQQGYQSISAEILKKNTAMLKLAEKSGFTLTPSPDDKTLVQAKRSLLPPEAAEKRKFR
ncbi:bifunctional acetate--CoA ligase family protein/GNAT family N-acetyltransferase [Neisseria chenwenguii]|uniref:bifunctional acetate--CoA ligase family protein/GNAT family N-acetyltransferase n=1 Tax=Neisseria chenwenguii TaxID=1853278 RepID=UPI000F5106E6|nr:bifunctional acetate--CoA ligase family protein/GNAT family N-acetyltransferase [Neisseria chenwenguii]ROV54055.1 GNAT family N-acetyltransferase [Neisseria chenwenguii]